MLPCSQANTIAHGCAGQAGARVTWYLPLH